MPFKFTTKDVVINGKSRSFKIVEHPGAAVIVAERDGKVALLRQFRPAVDSYLWELPAGTLDPGEDPDVCAARELEEETGFRPRRVERLGKIYPCPGYSTEVIYVYHATGLEPGQRNLDEGEVIDQVEWLAPERLNALMAAGDITDAKTIAALQIYALKGADEEVGR